ncbi:hypothetical protein [Pseudomonas alliivorans]|uniref:hypothetical protein n=1 Tax=Pseudomonas fragariae (ex Marin et al. 2024) TaxID=3080056 RepID=UPI002ED0295E|nr:hypothetical protein [Pseudomonas alliivorans]
MRVRKNLAAKIGGFLLASLIAGTSLPAFVGNDCDLDNDHSTDKYNVGAPSHAKKQ